MAGEERWIVAGAINNYCLLVLVYLYPYAAPPSAAAESRTPLDSGQRRQRHYGLAVLPSGRGKVPAGFHLRSCQENPGQHVYD